MPYTTPTSEQFQEKFPEFVAVNDTVVDQLISEASRFVDTSWTEDDYQTAILYLAAHMLNAASEQVAGGEISSESFGPISVSYRSGVDRGSLSSSQYGRRFNELMRVNVPSVMVI